MIQIRTKEDTLTVSLLETWKRLKGMQPSDPTIHDLFSQTTKATFQTSKALIERLTKEADRRDHVPHVPMFAAYPSSQLLSSYLFKPGMKSHNPLPSIEVDAKSIQLKVGAVENYGLRFFKQKYTISIPVRSRSNIAALAFQPLSKITVLDESGPCASPSTFAPIGGETIINGFSGTKSVDLSFELVGAKAFYPEKCSQWINPFDVEVEVVISDGSMVMSVLTFKITDYGKKVVVK